jgi:hypothetical protein
MGGHECSSGFFVCKEDTQGNFIIWHMGMVILKAAYCPFCGKKSAVNVHTHDLVPLFKEEVERSNDIKK